MLRSIAGISLVAVFALVSLPYANADAQSECIPGTETEDYCVFEEGSVNILPQAISGAATFDQSFLVYNPTQEVQEVQVRVGCVIANQLMWFENNQEREVDAEFLVNIPPDDQVVVAVHVPLREFGSNDCETWQGSDPYAYIASADIVNRGNPMVIYGNTKFTLSSDYERSQETTTTTTTLPGTGGCDVRFVDVLDPECDPEDGNIFFDDIEWLAETGITRGCNPPDNTLFCPKDFVTRGQMGAFLVRALDLTDDGGGNLFVDDDSSVFEDDIDRLGTAGVTRGCNPPDNDRFCPDDFVTRGQMGAFLVRALGLDDIPWEALPDFQDVPEDHIFRNDIGLLAEHGITRGCNPPDNDRFCPEAPVTREQMAAFLHRALSQ